MCTSSNSCPCRSAWSNAWASCDRDIVVTCSEHRQRDGPEGPSDQDMRSRTRKALDDSSRPARSCASCQRTSWDRRWVSASTNKVSVLPRQHTSNRQSVMALRRRYKRWAVRPLFWICPVARKCLMMTWIRHRPEHLPRTWTRLISREFIQYVPRTISSLPPNLVVLADRLSISFMYSMGPASHSRTPSSRHSSNNRVLVITFMDIYVNLNFIPPTQYLGGYL